MCRRPVLARPKEVNMPYTFTLTTTIPASPEEIYQAWLDSLGHSEMTGGAASMSDQVGAAVSAWDGYISGRNLELVPGERIVQSWRTIEFADEHGDSVITVVLQEIGEGTLLTLEHSNVPDEHRSYEEGGWQQNYFEPMVAYFAERTREDTAAPPKQAARKTAPKRAAKNGRNAKRAAGAKSKRAAPRAKASPNKRKGKSQGKPRRAVIASPARKRAKPAKRKSGRGKRS
jgi:uncharacterized protein YndB with AHSA1/START domain